MAAGDLFDPEEMAEICGFQWRGNVPFRAVAVFREFDSGAAVFDLFHGGHCIQENFMGYAPVYPRHLEEMITHPYWKAGIIGADFAVGTFRVSGELTAFGTTGPDLIHYSLMLAERPNQEIGPLGWKAPGWRR